MFNKFLKLFKKFCIYIKCHRIISIAIVIAIILLAVIIWPKSEKKIDTIILEKDTFVQTITANGKIEAEKSVDLNFLSGGQLVYLGAKRGDTVYAYQTIAALDQRSVKKNLETALINYSQQRLEFDETRINNQNRTPEQALNDTMKRLLENNQYDLNKTIISVELQELIRQQSVLTSPISGILTRADIETTGVNITPVTTYTVTDPTSMIFEMDINEADISNIKIGQVATISLDAYPNEPIEAKIEFIDFITHKTDTGGDAFTVKVRLPNNNELKYKVGMNGNAEIIVYEKENAIFVPISSITGDDFIYVKNNNKFEKRKVKIGLQNDTSNEVLEGLNLGEEIVIDAALIANGN